MPPASSFSGAEVDPCTIRPGGTSQPRMSASGTGLSFRAAFEGCIGEGVELLSQFQSATDTLATATHRTPLLEQAGLPDSTPLDWISARHALDDTLTEFPADICLRRGTGHILAPPWPLSIGCAAGPSFDAAILHALLELIERDAAALWWRGGLRGRLLPLDGAAARQALDCLTRIRGATQRRRCWLLDITTDLGVPSVAAVSVNQHGHNFACGLAARLTLPQAAQAAIHEMCQMELAHEVVAAKIQESGDTALNIHDRAHLRRGQELNPQDCTLLHPLPPATASATIDETTSLRQLIRHLQDKGIETFVIDLTRSGFGIPVARVLCPMLEKEPSQIVGNRLHAAIQRTGGGHLHTNGIPLM